MKKILDIETWERKSHFNFYKSFDEPFWGVTVNINCTIAYNYCKKNALSFFLYYLHQSLVVANLIEPFRYRISGEQVYVFDTVNAAPTINRDNGTFGFAYMDYKKDFPEFSKIAEIEIARIRNTSELTPAVSGENVIHYSSLPWLNFSSFSNARSFSFPDSCPKIVFGKITGNGGKMYMPVSIHVHHALVDGLHVGLFVDEYQKIMDEKAGH